MAHTGRTVSVKDCEGGHFVELEDPQDRDSPLRYVCTTWAQVMGLMAQWGMDAGIQGETAEGMCRAIPNLPNPDGSLNRPYWALPKEGKR